MSSDKVVEVEKLSKLLTSYVNILLRLFYVCLYLFVTLLELFSAVLTTPRGFFTENSSIS